jgi:hypothetical protein
VTQRNSTDAALAILPALHGHEPAADEGALAVVHEDPPDDPAPAWIQAEEVVTPFCLWPLTEQSPFTRNWPGSAFTTVPFGSRQLPVERPVDVILRSHRLHAPVPSNPTMATYTPSGSPESRLTKPARRGPLPDSRRSSPSALLNG